MRMRTNTDEGIHECIHLILHLLAQSILTLLHYRLHLRYYLSALCLHLLPQSVVNLLLRQSYEDSPRGADGVPVYKLQVNTDLVP